MSQAGDILQDFSQLLELNLLDTKQKSDRLDMYVPSI